MNNFKQFQKFGEGRKETFVNLKEALQENENFVVEGEAGVGKIAALKEFCEQLGLKHDVVNCLITEDIIASVNVAVDKGAQVIVIDEPNRIPTSKQIEVFQIFRSSDVKIVISINTWQHKYFADESEIGFKNWMKENSVKLVKVSL